MRCHTCGLLSFVFSLWGCIDVWLDELMLQIGAKYFSPAFIEAKLMSRMLGGYGFFFGDNSSEDVVTLNCCENIINHF